MNQIESEMDLIERKIQEYEYLKKMYEQKLNELLYKKRIGEKQNE